MNEMPKRFESSDDIEKALRCFNSDFEAIENEIGRLIVGMTGIVRGTLTAFFAGGHVLLEGAPGLGKTRLVRAIAKVLGLSFKRVQFTPDLMPSDVTGTQVLTEDDKGRRSFSFKKGPLFANIILADEINRATPKTQSALLEAMEESQVTVLGETHKLSAPFFVLATQNPIELEGTYPLPEAQLDRFLLKLIIKNPDSEELKEILNRTTGSVIPEVKTVFESARIQEKIAEMKALVRHVSVAAPLQEVLVRMMDALTPDSQFATAKVNQYVRFGPGPRGAQAVILAAKVSAVLDSRINLAFSDIREVMIPALRHRIVLNFQAEADGVGTDEIIEEVRNAK